MTIKLKIVKYKLFFINMNVQDKFTALIGVDKSQMAAERTVASITSITQTISAGGLARVNNHKVTPEQICEETYHDLFRLNQLIDSILSTQKSLPAVVKGIKTQNTKPNLNRLYESLRTIALRYDLVDETSKQFIDLIAAMNEYDRLLLDYEEYPDELEKRFAPLTIKLAAQLSIVVESLREGLEQKHASFDIYTNQDPLEDAKEQSKVALAQTNILFNPLSEVDLNAVDNEDLKEELLMTVSDELAKVESFNSKEMQFIKLLLRTKLDLLLADPVLRSRFSAEEIKAARLAFARTLINFTIGILDVVPVGGDTVSWFADAIKAVKTAAVRLKIRAKFLPGPLREYLDMTPDVSLSKAVLTEGYEFLTFGFMPSHLIFEFREQFKADLRIMIPFLEKVIREKAALNFDREAAGLGSESEDQQLLDDFKAIQKDLEKEE